MMVEPTSMPVIFMAISKDLSKFEFYPQLLSYSHFCYPEIWTMLLAAEDQ